MKFLKSRFTLIAFAILIWGLAVTGLWRGYVPLVRKYMIPKRFSVRVTILDMMSHRPSSIPTGQVRATK